VGRSLVPLNASAGLVPVGRRLTGYLGTEVKHLPHCAPPSATDADDIAADGQLEARRRTIHE